jgi:hypothetical protein
MDLIGHGSESVVPLDEHEAVCQERDGYQAGLRNLEVQNDSLRQQLQGAVPRVELEAVARRAAEKSRQPGATIESAVEWAIRTAAGGGQ